jgi:ADP-ribosylglycohydrolase
MSATFTTADRILACLQGIAAGDAIGKQTEVLSPDSVQRWYPGGVRGFEGAPDAVIPRYASHSKHQWRVGETTDDTERTVAVARAIIAEQSVSHVSVGRAMLDCTKCVHAGVRSLWEFHQAGDPARMATAHDGCGAAIRAAPVGIFYASDCLDALVLGAWEASISTHAGALAIAGAAANAAAVSAAIDGRPASQILEIAVQAAARAEMRWAGRSESAFAAAVREVHDDLASLTALRPQQVAARCFPDQPLRIVPLALALATIMQSAEDAILVAANVGGDSDSVASIAGGILGARNPSSVNQHWCDVVASVNKHDLAGLARELIPLRRRCSEPAPAI